MRGWDWWISVSLRVAWWTEGDPVSKRITYHYWSVEIFIQSTNSLSIGYVIIYNNYFTSKYNIAVFFHSYNYIIWQTILLAVNLSIFLYCIIFSNIRNLCPLKITNISNVSFDILDGLDLMFKAMILEKVTFEYGMRWGLRFDFKICMPRCSLPYSEEIVSSSLDSLCICWE